VNTHVAEVVAEARLEERTSGGVEGMARRTKDVADDARNVDWSSGRGSAALDCWGGLFQLAFFAHFRAFGAGAGSASGFAHDGAGDVVGFAFFGVVGIADGELSLKETGAKKLLHGLVAGELLQLEGARKRRSGGRSGAVMACQGGTCFVLTGFGDAFHEMSFRPSQDDAAEPHIYDGARSRS
jgi:hypothetical protein